MKSINLKNETDFMSLMCGGEIFKFIAHGEDLPIKTNSWFVKIEATRAGGIPKVGICMKDTEEIFFVHLLKNDNVIIDDDAKIFFDFMNMDENLGVKKLSEN